MYPEDNLLEITGMSFYMLDAFRSRSQQCKSTETKIDWLNRSQKTLYIYLYLLFIRTQGTSNVQ